MSITSSLNNKDEYHLVLVTLCSNHYPAPTDIPALYYAYTLQLTTCQRKYALHLNLIYTINLMQQPATSDML